MATSRCIDQDGHPGIQDDVTVPSGNGQDVTRYNLGDIAYSVPAYQGICDITVDIHRSKYVSTPALDEADAILQRSGWVILCGPPGCGKTTLARALASRSRDQGFSPCVLERVEQLKPKVGKSPKSVAVLDGTLGKVRINSQQYECWELVLDTVVKLREEGTCRFVITVYPHVLRELQQLETDRNSPLLDSSAVVWLTGTLPEDVKVQLMNFYLNKLHLETDRQRQVVEQILKTDVSGPVFPCCCGYMVEQWEVSHDPTAIFCAPAWAYTGLLKKMVLDHDHGTVFAVLFSLTMKGMSCFLNSPLKTETHLKELGLCPYSPDELAAYADVLLGSILSEGTFSSRALYEAAGLVLGLDFQLPVLVAVCDVPFLVQYVDIKPLNHRVSEDQPSGVCVTVGSVPCCSRDPKQCGENLQSLVKRIYTEIVQGNLQLICQHPCLQCPQFLQGLVDHCAGNGLKIKKLLKAVDSEHQLPLVYWSAILPSHHLTHWCLLKMQADIKLSTRALIARSLFDNITQKSQLCLKSLLHETLTARYFDHPEHTMEFPLHAKDQCLTKEMQKQIKIITETGSTEGLLYLLHPSLPIPPDVVTLQMTRGKLRLQVKNQCHWYVVFRLLTDREANEKDSDGNSLLHIAISYEQFTTVRLCLKAVEVITQQNRKGVTPYQMTRRTHSQLPKTRETGRIDQIFRRFPDLDMAEVRLLLQELSVEDRDSDGRTGLLVACREGWGDIADLYIDLGADVNVKDRVRYRCSDAQGTCVARHDGCTPLQYACKNGLVHTVEKLVQHWADDTNTTKDRLTALHFVCQCPSDTAFIAITRLLFGLSGDDFNTEFTQRDSFLHHFAKHRYSDALAVLIQHGADINTKNENGYTPLHWAVLGGHLDTVDLLIHHGADANTNQKKGFTPFHVATLNGYTDIAELLIRHGADINTQGKEGFTPLHWAAWQGHTDTAELLIHHGADVNIQNKEGNTPFYLAAQNGHTDTAELLIRHGADVNTQNKKGNTPFHVAALKGHTDTAELLIRHGADVNTQGEKGATPFHLAALNGHRDTAELLIHHGTDVNTQSKDGTTPFHLAALNGHTDTAELLIRHGADVKIQCKGGSTPIHLAACQSHTDTAELLIRHGADVNTQDKKGNTPFHLAAEEGHTDTAELLIRHGADVNTHTKKEDTPFHLAALNGHTDIAELLIRHGADVNTQNKEGFTPFHLAALNSHTDTAELLIRHGADVNTQNTKGNTPFHFAAQEGHMDTAELLLRHGADVNTHNEKEAIPFHLAVFKGQTDIAELLIRHGADVNTQNKNGATLCHLAAFNGHRDTAELLIRHGADVKTQNKEGFTPIHLAARQGHTDTAKLLIRHGADVNTQDKEGATPFHVAAYWGHTDIAELLLHHGGDVNTQDNEGFTPFHLAAQEGHTDIAKLLLHHGADVSTQDRERNVPHWVAQKDHLDEI